MTAGRGGAFAVWITGLPASGKSALAAALAEALGDLGISALVLESDQLREILTPSPTYSPAERERFYRTLLELGGYIVARGVPVILDATAHRRMYRESARSLIPRFVEVFVDCPLQVCMDRDPKGIYRQAKQGLARTVPGLQIPFEVSERADIRIRGDREAPRAAARRVVALLDELGFLRAARAGVRRA